MKKYFDFTLTGKKFLPIWLIFYILIIMPYAFYYKSLTGQAQSGNPNPMIGFLFLGIMIIAFLISYYILKLTIENVKYNNNKIDFNGKFSIFLGKVLLGFLLSIVTLTIYMAWFIRDITRFVVNNSSIEGTRFEFDTDSFIICSNNCIVLGYGETLDSFKSKLRLYPYVPRNSYDYHDSLHVSNV